jgi:hypothetical protein
VNKLLKFLFLNNEEKIEKLEKEINYANKVLFSNQLKSNERQAVLSIRNEKIRKKNKIESKLQQSTFS